MKKGKMQTDPQPAAPKFTKRQFMKAANFTRIERDVLSVLMKDKESYTLEQANKMLADYTKRKVK